MKRLVSSFLITFILGIIIIFSYNYFSKKNEYNSSNNMSDAKYVFDNSFTNTLLVEELDNIISSKDTLLMLGNKSSNTSAKMLAFLKDIKNDYNLEIYYLEVNEGVFKSDEYTNFVTKYEIGSNAYFEPNLMVFKEHKYVLGYPGDASYRNIKNFLEYTEVIRSDTNE